MKNGITNSLAVAAVGAVMAFSIGQAEAVPTPVGGVIVDTDTTFVFSNLTENFVDGRATSCPASVRSRRSTTWQGMSSAPPAPTAN